MNIFQKEIINELFSSSYISQRKLSEKIGCSLGMINQSLRGLINNNFLDDDINLTDKAIELKGTCKVNNAIILAAGYGLRMVPISSETSKGLLVVRGERLVERIIHQLHDVGIKDITIVVGYMKESYEYLIDKYDVKLKVNPEYAKKNNLHSLALVEKLISRTYIIPCDIWCEENCFKSFELYSWYMVGKETWHNSNVKINRKHELIRQKTDGNHMLGIAFIDELTAEKLTAKLNTLDSNSEFDSSFWEDALFDNNQMYVYGKPALNKNIIEINTFEELRAIDESNDYLNVDAIKIISEVFGVSIKEITNIGVLKKGMTNRSFTFICKGNKYIMRIPGKGTDELINREEEYNVYQSIKEYKLCDDIYYINPQNGYKITSFIEDAKNCNPQNWNEVEQSMKVLKSFHNREIKVKHGFNIYQQIEFYESLRKGKKSCYSDYNITKEHMYELKKYIDEQPKKICLTHIDAVPDNFLFTSKNGKMDIKLIDWEYAGMQDPHVDIAMFAIYSLYDRSEVDKLIDLYFNGKCENNTRRKIYCYIAACGLLWSNWCEYKNQLGVEFGEYSLRQYRYAKEYYKIFMEAK